MANDWFRKKTWTELDQKAFFERLNKSRSGWSKAQYLRIQAVELFEVKTKESALAAINLLQILLEKYPDSSQNASAYWCLGECKEFLGLWDDAISCYQKALEQQCIFPNMRTPAHLKFAHLVVVHQKRNKYDEALAHLDKWISSHGFPADIFLECSARAKIHIDRGERNLACQWALRALDAAAKTHSGFRYHPNLGLVGEKWVEQKKEMIAMLTDQKQ